jgi:hypothetical protein
VAGGLTVPVGAPAVLVSPVAWWIALAALAGVAAAAFYGAFRALRRARLVEDVPTSRVRSAAQGYVELVGTAELLPGEPIVAPLTGTPCAWYRYQVEEREPGRSGRTREWHTIEKGVSDGLFRLVDDSGACVVDPDDAEVTPSVRRVWLGESRRPGAPPAGRGWGWLLGGRYRYREEIIRPGDPLHAVGALRTVGSASEPAGVTDDVRHLLASWKRDPGRMRVFDANGDGHVDLQEWETARGAARAQVLRERAERAATPGIPVLAQPAERGQPFILAALAQSDLARRYRWSAVARLVLFLLAGAAWVALLGRPPPP